LYNHWLMPTISPFAYNNIFFNGTAVINDDNNFIIKTGKLIPNLLL
jgi:hypothetical protein